MDIKSGNSNVDAITLSTISFDSKAIISESGDITTNVRPRLTNKLFKVPVLGLFLLLLSLSFMEDGKFNLRKTIFSILYFSLYILSLYFSVCSSIFIVINIIILLCTVIVFKCTELPKFHGAEHKVIACHDAGLEINIENVKKMSRLTVLCGSNFVVIFSVFIAMSYLLGTLPYLHFLTKHPFLISFILANELRTVKFFSYPGLWAQKVFFTKEPDEKHLKVAIAAYDALKIAEDGELKAEEKEMKQTIGKYMLPW